MRVSLRPRLHFQFLVKADSLEIMILRMCEVLEPLRRLRLATVVTLSLALLALPCSPFVEALESNADPALTAATAASSGPSDPDWIHHANQHESNFGADCSIWLTALTRDGGATIIGISNSSRSNLLPVALIHVPSTSDWTDRAYRSTRPPSIVLVGTSLYSTTQRYRI